VDRVYRIDVGGMDSEKRARSGFETILDELVPYEERAQILFWPAAGTLSSSSTALAALAVMADAGDGKRLSASSVPMFTPRGLVLPAVVGTSWIARFKELVSRRESSIVLPPEFFDRLAAELADDGPPIEPPPPDPEQPTVRSFTILSLANTTRIEGRSGDTIGGLTRVRALRQRLEEEDTNLLVLHAGDVLFPSLLSRTFRGEQMIEALNLLDGDPVGFDDRLVVNIGNHELDGDRLPTGTSTLEKRIQESQFQWTSLNFSKLRRLPRPRGGPPAVIMTVNGIDIGIFGLLAPDPPRVGRPARSPSEMTRYLRERGAKVVIALSHQNYAENLAMLNSSPASDAPDLVLGGQDHVRIERKVDGRWLLVPEAEAAGVHVTKVGLTADGKVVIEPSYVQLRGDNPSGDKELLRLARKWDKRFDDGYCLELNLPAGCRNEVIGRTRTTLHGSEEAIRSQETNLGNWVADQMLTAFADRGAQVAFINAGALRLDDDIPTGNSITNRDLDALLAFPAPLVLLRLDGSTLRQVVSHAASSWPGSGRWLQIAGMAFRLETETRSASGLSRLVEGGADDARGSAGPAVASTIASVDLAPEEEVLAVTTLYLIDPTGDQDGYSMLSPSQVLAKGPDLKEVLVQALRRAPNGIAPEVEGRICIDNSLGPCLVRDGAAAEEREPRPLSVSGSLGTLRERPGCRAPAGLCWGAEPGLEVYWSPDESERKWSGPFLTDGKGEFSFKTEPGPLLLRAYKRHPLWRTLLWERRTAAGSQIEKEEIAPDPAYEPLAEVRDLPEDPFKRKEFVLGLNVRESAAEEIAEVRYFFDSPKFREGQTDPYYQGRQPVLRSRDPRVGFRVSYKGDGCLQTVTITVTYKDDTKPLTIDFAHCGAVKQSLRTEQGVRSNSAATPN